MSRTPWYALLIALFVMQFFYPQFRKVFIVISIVAAIVIWVTWDQVTESQMAARVNDKVSTMENREMRWQAGYKMWKVKPIRGWGFGQYGKHSGRFRTGSRANYGAVENDYLYLLVASGLIGFLPYAIFLLAPLVNSLRLFFRARAPDWPGFIEPGTIVTYWGVFLCLAITSYTALQTHSLIKMCTFAVAGGVIGTHEYLLRSSKDRKRSLPPTVRRAQGA
jgi:O-antigen ligase